MTWEGMVSNQLGGLSRRRELRYPVQVPVTIHRSFGDVEATTADVSHRGFFLSSNDPPLMRSYLRISLELPGDYGTVVLSGMVVHRVEPENDYGAAPGVGIKLYANDDDVLHTWNHFIKAQPQELEPLDGHMTDPEIGPVDSQVNAIVGLEFDNPTELFNMYAIDIPAGRMYLSTDQNLALHDKVLLDISVGDSETEFKLQAEVIHRSRHPGSFGVDVAFVNLADQVLADLWNFLCDLGPSADAEATDSPFLT